MKNKKAFTLIELIVSLAIISVLVLLISSMLMVNFKATKLAYKSDRSHKEATNTMLYIENVVREADRIEKRDSEVCNAYFYLDGSSYCFTINRETEKVYAKIKNEGKNSKEGTVLLGKANDLKVSFDGDKYITIYLQGIDEKNYQTKINIGIRQ